MARRKTASRSASKAEAPNAEAEPGEGPSFEEGIERLEVIVDRLEQGELPLEEALQAFEEGVSLTRRCAGQLEVAERRIEELVKEGDGWLARPFDGAVEDDA